MAAFWSRPISSRRTAVATHSQRFFEQGSRVAAAVYVGKLLGIERKWQHGYRYLGRS